MKILSKKFASVCIVWILFTSTGLSQVTKFQMSDYRYRTEGMKAMSLYGNFNSNVGKDALSSNYNSYLTVNPMLSYFRQYSTDKAQFDYWNNSTVNLGLSNQSNLPLGWNIRSQSTWNHRYYRDRKFFETGSNGYVHTFNSDLFGKNHTQSGLNIEPSVGIGIGRLEYVSNAQMALFILEDLSKAGKIKGTVSTENAEAFTTLITELYNTRVFDFRVRRNYEITKIDSFLRARKIIAAGDITTYNIISDNWNYAIQPPAIESLYSYFGSLLIPLENRLSDRINQFGVFGQARRYHGKRQSLKLNIQSSIDNFLSNSFIAMPTIVVPDSNYKNHVQSNIGAQLRYIWENHEALSLKVHRSYSFYGNIYQRYSELSRTYTNQPETSWITSNFGFQAGGDFMWQYFPNSRTILSSISSLSVDTYAMNINYRSVPGEMFIILNSALNANYFLTYHSRISGNVLVNMIYGPAGFDPGLSVGINYIHYLF